MAAIAAVFDQLPAGSIVVWPDGCYQGVAGLAEASARRGRWSAQRVASGNTAGWIRAKRFGAIVSFDVRGGAAAADAVCKSVTLIRHATSLGAVESTRDRRAAIPGQQHLPPLLWRLSVGIENCEDLWTDLDAALCAAAPWKAQR